MSFPNPIDHSGKGVKVAGGQQGHATAEDPVGDGEGSGGRWWHGGGRHRGARVPGNHNRRDQAVIDSKLITADP